MFQTAFFKNNNIESLIEEIKVVILNLVFRLTDLRGDEEYCTNCMYLATVYVIDMPEAWLWFLIKYFERCGSAISRLIHTTER